DWAAGDAVNEQNQVKALKVNLQSGTDMLGSPNVRIPSQKSSVGRRDQQPGLTASPLISPCVGLTLHGYGMRKNYRRTLCYNRRPEPTLPAPSASGTTGRSRCDSSLNLPLMLLFCGPTARSASKDPLLRWNVDQVVLLNHNGKPIVCHPHVQRDNRATVDIWVRKSLRDLATSKPTLEESEVL
ncbi:unnamed protein product, partial [Gadus morhua 'NCC']